MGKIIDFFRRSTLRRQAVWADVASRRGGRHIIPKWYKSANERIEVVVSGVAMVLDTYTESTGNSSVNYTRCIGRSAQGNLPAFRVYKQGAFSTFGKFLGTQDLHLGGDDEFDDTFMVKADDAAAAREVWSAAAKSIMRGPMVGARIESTENQIELKEVGQYKNPTQLNAALDLVAELASRDLYGVAALQIVGGPGFEQKKNGYPQTQLTDPAPVLIATREVSGRLASVASLKNPGKWKAMTALIQEGALVDPNSFQQFSALARAQVEAVGTAALVIEDQQPPRVVWPSVEHDPERLIAGARMLGALEGIGQQRL